MIIGASGESDFHLLSLTQQLYQQYDMKRVFYSAYVPLNDDPELPAIGTAPHSFAGTSFISGRLAASVLWISGG